MSDLMTTTTTASGDELPKTAAELSEEHLRSFGITQNSTFADMHTVVSCIYPGGISDMVWEALEEKRKRITMSTKETMKEKKRPSHDDDAPESVKKKPKLEPKLEDSDTEEAEKRETLKLKQDALHWVKTFLREYTGGDYDKQFPFKNRSGKKYSYLVDQGVLVERNTNTGEYCWGKEESIVSFLCTHMRNDEKTIREFCDDLHDSLPDARIIKAIYAKKGWNVEYLKRLKLHALVEWYPDCHGIITKKPKKSGGKWQYTVWNDSGYHKLTEETRGLRKETCREIIKHPIDPPKESDEYPLVSTQENERFEKHLQVQEDVKAAYQKEGAARTTEENIEKQKKNAAEPFFQLRQKVLAGPEKIKCIVKNMKNNCVLLERSDEDDEEFGQKRWFDISKCSPVLDKDGKPVIEPECQITITFPNTKENENPTKSGRIQVPLGPSADFEERMRKKREETRERFWKGYRKLGRQKLGHEKRIIVEKLSLLIDGSFPSEKKDPTVFFTDYEELQSDELYVCSFSSTEAEKEHIAWFPCNKDAWSDDGGTQEGSLPLRRLLDKYNCCITWRHDGFFIIPCVYIDYEWYKKHYPPKGWAWDKDAALFAFRLMDQFSLSKEEFGNFYFQYWRITGNRATSEIRIKDWHGHGLESFQKWFKKNWLEIWKEEKKNGLEPNAIQNWFKWFKKHKNSNPHAPKSKMMLSGIAGENKGNEQMQDLERICSTLPKEDIQKALDILNKRNIDVNAIDLIDDTEAATTNQDPVEAATIEAASGSSSKRKADEPEQTPESSKRQKTSTPEKYSVEYFNEYEKPNQTFDEFKRFQFRIWTFIDKGPTFVFDIFDKDIKLHNWFKNINENERDTFFFMCTRSMHTGYHHVRPIFTEDGEEKKFYERTGDSREDDKRQRKAKKIRRQWITDNIKEWDLQSLKRLVEKYGFQYMDEHLSNFDLNATPSKYAMEFARDTLSLDLREAIVSGKKSIFHKRGKSYVNYLLRDEYEIKGNFTKKEGEELLADLLNIPREISIYDAVIDDAKSLGVEINRRDLQNMGVKRMHNWYSDDVTNGKYFKNIQAIDAEKAKEMILQAVVCPPETRLHSKVKEAYESLNTILLKKRRKLRR